MHTSPDLRAAIALPAPPGWLAVSLSRLSRLAAPAVLLCVWQGISTLWLDETTRALLPPPTAVAIAGWDLLVSGELLHHLRDSLRREFIAFAWALSAIPVGVAMGWWRGVLAEWRMVVDLMDAVYPLELLTQTMHLAMLRAPAPARPALQASD